MLSRPFVERGKVALSAFLLPPSPFAFFISEVSGSLNTLQASLSPSLAETVIDVTCNYVYCMEMLENGQDRGHFGIIGGETENIHMVSSEQVEGDGSYMPASEDEIIEVDHLLGGPKDDLLDDGVLYMDSENSQKCLAIEDFPCPIGYCEIKNAGDSGTIQEGRPEMNSKFEFLDDMLKGVEEDLHVTNNLSTDCGDYLLDTRFAEAISHLEYDACQGNGFENLSSECHYPTLTGRENGSTGLSNLSTAIIPLTDASFDESALCLDNLTLCELHETFRTIFGRETSVQDKQWLIRRISHGLRNFYGYENACSLLESQLSSDEIEDSMLLTSVDDSSGGIYNSFANICGENSLLASSGMEIERNENKDVLTTGLVQAGKLEFGLSNVGSSDGLSRKRLRKPTRRYIEESSDIKSRFNSGRFESPNKGSRDKFFRVKSHNQQYWKGFEGMALVCRQDSLGGSGIQVPFVLRVRRGRPRKNCTSLMVDKDSKDHMLLSVVPKKFCGLEPSHSESQYDLSDSCAAASRTVKGGIRRKHHRLWTLSEVLKLVEGVSRHGVGRWSDIKKLEFSSSVYRTSVDLKDKWRNLLRASYAQLQSKKEVEQRRKHASVPIPASVLVRVRELAGMYPKEQQHHLPTPIGSGKIVQRRHFM